MLSQNLGLLSGVVALRRLRQEEDRESEASLGYRVRSRPAYTTQQDRVSKHRQNLRLHSSQKYICPHLQLGTELPKESSENIPGIIPRLEP